MTAAPAITQAIPLEEAIQKRLEEIEAEYRRQEAEKAWGIARQDEIRESIRQWVSAQVAERDGVAVDPARWDVVPFSGPFDCPQEFEIGLWEDDSATNYKIPVELAGRLLWDDESKGVNRGTAAWGWMVSRNCGDSHRSFSGLVDAILFARGVGVDL